MGARSFHSRCRARLSSRMQVELVAQEGRKEVTEEMVEASLYISDHIKNVASSSCMVMTM
jgi:hypothetical protein